MWQFAAIFKMLKQRIREISGSPYRYGVAKIHKRGKITIFARI
jgi:hypothetical protein